jgi:hypothetical protein
MVTTAGRSPETDLDRTKTLLLNSPRASCYLQYFGNKPQQGQNPYAAPGYGGLQSDVAAPHGSVGGYAPNNAPQAFVNQQVRAVHGVQQDAQPSCV